MYLIHFISPVSNEMVLGVIRWLCVGYGILGLACFWRAWPGAAKSGV